MTTRPKLARGTRLQIGHLHDLPDTIDAQMAASNVSLRGEARAPWEVCWNIPGLDSTFFEHAALASNDERLGASGWFVPVCFPPMQEDFEFPQILSNIPRLVIEELVFSFDQRGESAAIVGQGWNMTDVGAYDPWVVRTATEMASQGKLDTQNTTPLTNLRLTLWSKPQTWQGSPLGGAGDTVDATRQKYLVTEQHLDIEVPVTVLTAASFRDNPFVVRDLSITVDPFRTYLLGIHAPNMNATVGGVTARWALVNVLLTMRGVGELLARDVGCQNQPTRHAGAKLAPSPALDAGRPTDPAEINADGHDGGPRRIQVIDEELRKGLRGGYTKHGANPPLGNHLALDACFDIIAVPMWGNQPCGIFDGGNDGGGAPLPVGTSGLVSYTGLGDGSGAPPAWGGAGPVTDRRIVLIDYPFTIHHVVAAHNWQGCGTKNDKAERFLPMNLDGGINSGDITHTVGVGIGHAIRMDASAARDRVCYQQVAHREITLFGTVDLAYQEAVVDRICQPSDVEQAEPRPPIWELWSVPIVERTGDTPRHWYGKQTAGTDQGIPFWVGRSIVGVTDLRSNVGAVGGASAAPATAGLEQFIEVRWSIGLNNGEEFATLGAADQRTILSGYGGGWVYLLGKKHLV